MKLFQVSDATQPYVTEETIQGMVQAEVSSTVATTVVGLKVCVGIEVCESSNNDVSSSISIKYYRTFIIIYDISFYNKVFLNSKSRHFNPLFTCCT